MDGDEHGVVAFWFTVSNVHGMHAAEITGFLGVYSNPNHIVAYADGETRQQYEASYIGRPIGGAPRVNEEALDVRWIRPDDLDSYDVHPSMREQIGHYLAGTYPYLG